MALRPDNTLISNREMVSELLLAPFAAVARWIENYAVSNARTQAIRAVADMTDAELQAKGLTRAEAMRMVFPHDA